MRPPETAHQAFVRHVTEAHGRSAMIQLNGPVNEMEQGTYRFQVNVEHPPEENPWSFREKIKRCLNKMPLTGSGVYGVKGPDRHLTRIVLFSETIHNLRELQQALLPLLRK